MRQTLLSALAALLALACVLAGCSSSQPAALTKPDIIGTITSVSFSGMGKGSPGAIFIEGKIANGTHYDKASVTITKDTSVFQQSGSGAVGVPASMLAEGQKVQATFTGAVAQSYPVQATAREIVILSAKTINSVKDENAARLMAIKGVVGVGIGKSGGRQVIVVFVAQDSPALRSQIPKTLEGYEVVTRVTGAIKTQ